MSYDPFRERKATYQVSIKALNKEQSDLITEFQRQGVTAKDIFLRGLEDLRKDMQIIPDNITK